MVQMLASPLNSETIDHHFLYIDRTWAQFQFLQKGYEDTIGVRLSFFEDQVEVFMPGRLHERFSELIGSLFTIFFALKGIAFFPDGSTTQERDGFASIQPDKSYCIGSEKARPDLAIEVVVTSGGIGKLRLYEALGIPEVWFWEDGTLVLYGLRDEGRDERLKQSAIEGLRDLDLDLFQRCIMLGETSPVEAVKMFMAGLG